MLVVNVVTCVGLSEDKDDDDDDKLSRSLCAPLSLH